MALFSKDGKEFIELPDSSEDFDKMKEAGYQPYMAFTSDGEEYIALPAEVSNLKKMQEAGYKTAADWDYMQGAGKPRVQPGAGEAFLGGAAEELSLGAGKFAGALASSVLPGGSSFGKELEVQKYLQKRREEEQPLATGLGKLTGAIGTGMATAGASGIIRAAAPATTLAGRIGMGAAGEAIPEAVKGVLQSEEEDLGGKLLEGGVKNALIGATIGGFGGALTKVPDAVSATGEAIKTTGKVLSSAQEAAIEAGRKNEGAGIIMKPIRKLGGVIENISQNLSTRKETKALVNELREQMGEEVADIPDKELLAYVSALPGPNPVKRWQAIKIANATNGNVDEIMRALETGPDAVTAARMFDKRATAEGIAVDMEGALNRLKPAMQKRYGELEARAKQNFAKQGYDAQASLLEAMTDLSTKQSDEARTIMKELQDVYASFAGVPSSSLGDVTERGISPTARLLLEQRGGTRWTDLTPAEQFDILKKARKDIDNSLKQKGVFKDTPKQSMTANQSIMKDVRDRINELIKTSDEMVENDATYKPFKDLEDILLQGAIKNKDTNEITIVPEKMLALFKDTQAGGLLRKQIELAGLYAERLPAQESVEIKSVLNSINEALEAATQAKGLEAVYKASSKLTKSQVKGLEAFFGEGQLPIVGVVSPEDKVKSYARLVEFSKRFLQKDSFDQLSPKEKMALLELEALTRKKGMIGKDALLEATWQKIAKKKKLGV